MRRVIPALILLLALYFIISRFTEVEQIVQTLQRSNPLWVGLAILVQMAWSVTIAFVYKYTYRLLGMESGVSHLLPLIITNNFIKDRKSTRLNSSHLVISYAVFCLKKKNNHHNNSQSSHIQQLR